MSPSGKGRPTQSLLARVRFALPGRIETAGTMLAANNHSLYWVEPKKVLNPDSGLRL